MPTHPPTMQSQGGLVVLKEISLSDMSPSERRDAEQEVRFPRAALHSHGTSHLALDHCGVVGKTRDTGSDLGPKGFKW
jgi:hypothetical protein